MLTNLSHRSCCMLPGPRTVAAIVPALLPAAQHCMLSMVIGSWVADIIVQVMCLLGQQPPIGQSSMLRWRIQLEFVMMTTPK
jgi:hypothetical protein